MKNSKRIQGMEELLEKLPEDYRHWHLFGSRMVDFHFERIFDDKEKFAEIACISMILADRDNRYPIKMRLTDVCGEIRFDVLNGFFSGFTIMDTLAHDKECGWETERCFVLTSFEQDISFKIRCKSISVELMGEPMTEEGADSR